MADLILARPITADKIRELIEEKLEEAELSKTRFNKVVLGSDIIWDYSQEMFHNDQFLFGNRYIIGAITC